MGSSSFVVILRHLVIVRNLLVDFWLFRVVVGSMIMVFHFASGLVDRNA